MGRRLSSMYTEEVEILMVKNHQGLAQKYVIELCSRGLRPKLYCDSISDYLLKKKLKNEI